MNARTLLAPFSFLWRRILQPVFQALDHGLVRIAALFGALEPSMLRRAAWMNGLFLGLYALALLPVPWLPLLALLFGYVGVLSVGRAWVANEKLRTDIVKKLDNTDPDTLPDLRAAALLTALHLLILFPLLFWQLAKHFPDQLFRVQPDAAFGDWLEFAFEPYAKSVFDLIEGHSHSLDIVATSSAGRFVVLLKRLTLDFILIQGVVRLFAINTTIREGVAALRNHPDITIRLGRRAVGPLTGILTTADAEADSRLKAQAAMVLGQLRATRAVPDLITALGDRDAEVRWRAVTALGEIGNPEATPAVLQALRDPDPNTARAALDALVALEARDTVETLRWWLHDRNSAPPLARVLAAEGFRLLAGNDGVETLITTLRDSDEDVAKAAAASLGLLADERAVEPLGRVATDSEAPKWLRYEATKALEAAGKPTAVPSLLAALIDADPALRRLAARALGTLGDPTPGPALLAALRDPESQVREAVALAVGALAVPDGPEQLVLLLRDPHAEVRDAATEAMLQYGELAVAALERELPAAEGDTRTRIEGLLGKLKG